MVYDLSAGEGCDGGCVPGCQQGRCSSQCVDVVNVLCVAVEGNCTVDVFLCIDDDDVLMKYMNSKFFFACAGVMSVYVCVCVC